MTTVSQINPAYPTNDEPEAKPAVDGRLVFGAVAHPTSFEQRRALANKFQPTIPFLFVPGEQGSFTVHVRFERAVKFSVYERIIRRITKAPDEFEPVTAPLAMDGGLRSAELTSESQLTLTERQVVPIASPGEPVKARLFELYFEVNETGRTVPRHGVPESEKAEVVLSQLRDEEATLVSLEEQNATAVLTNGRLHILNADNPTFRQLWRDIVGVVPAESTAGKRLIRALEDAILADPATVRVRGASWAHHDLDNDVLWLCLDPAQADVLRVDASGLHSVANGSGEVLLVPPRGRRRGFDSTVEPAAELFRDVVVRAQACDPLDQVMSTVYDVASLIPGVHPRPIKYLLGAPGSGKSESAANTTTVLYGKAAVASYESGKVLWPALAYQGPLVVHDNVETSTRKRFEAEYLVAATAGYRTDRKLYSNGDEIRYYPRGNLVVSAVEGATTPELRSRSLEFEFSSEFHDPNRQAQVVRQRTLTEGADGMLAGILVRLGERVLPSYVDRVASAEEWIRAVRPHHAKSRMNGFLAIMHLVLEAFADLFDVEDPKATMLAFIDRQTQREQDTMVEAEPVVGLLDALAAVRRTAGGAPGVQSIGGLAIECDVDNVVTIGPAKMQDLFLALSRVARRAGAVGMARPFDNARQLAARLRSASERGVLAAAGWTLSRAACKAHGNVATWVLTHQP